MVNWKKLVPMSLIRRHIADRLVRAQQQAALLTTFNEVDMSAVKQLRGDISATPFRRDTASSSV